MKKSMLICAPLTSRSGYGDHARDLFHSFYDLGRFDIKVLDVRWGGCPRNALDPTNKKDKIIIDRIIRGGKIDSQPDVYVDIRIPNEFQTFGKFNIGITAGIETDIIAPAWVEGCNKMDLIIVPSEHSKRGLVETIYDKIQDGPDDKPVKVGDHSINKPVEVLFEGIDSDVYKDIPIGEDDTALFHNIDKLVKEEFAFLSVGLWGAGNFGEDRKNIGKLVKVFYEAFANKKKKPALILKTNGAGFSVLDKAETVRKLNEIKSFFPDDFDLPNVYLLHGDLSKEELNSLYNHPKVKAMISLTHGEGFGRPLLEASFTGLPIIATNWSGHLDFLDDGKSILLPGKLDTVPKSVIWENIIVEESKWFDVDDNSVYDSLNHVFTNYFDFKRNAQRLKEINRSKFTFQHMVEKLGLILDNHLTTQVGIKLPKLKTINEPTSTGIKLPKFKGVTNG